MVARRALNECINGKRVIHEIRLVEIRVKIK